MLVALGSAQRGQKIYLLNVNNITKTDSSYSFRIPELTKTSKPGDKANIVSLMAFTPDTRLCVYHCLTEYLKRTQTL